MTCYCNTKLNMKVTAAVLLAIIPTCASLPGGLSNEALGINLGSHGSFGRFDDIYGTARGKHGDLDSFKGSNVGKHGITHGVAGRRSGSRRNVHPQNVHPHNVHPQNVHPHSFHPQNVHPQNVHPQNVSPRRGGRRRGGRRRLERLGKGRRLGRGLGRLNAGHGRDRPQEVSRPHNGIGHGISSGVLHRLGNV